MDGQLKDAEIVNNRTFDTLAYEASDNSYVKVDNKGSVTFHGEGRRRWINDALFL